MQSRVGNAVLAKVKNMLTKKVVAFCVLVLLGAFVLPSSAQKAAGSESPTNARLDARYESWKALQTTERFSGPLMLKSTKGKPLSIAVGLRLWSIDAVRGPQKLLIPEFTVFHLRAGTLKTMIDGKEETRKTDDFWVLPAGSQMSVQVKGETAVVETTSVSPK